jgi:UBX domain
MLDGEASLPPEPAAILPTATATRSVVTLRVRLPSGVPCQRRFHGDNTVGEVRRWVDAQLARACDECTLRDSQDLITHYDLVPGGLRAKPLVNAQQTLSAAQLRGRSMLIVRELDPSQDEEGGEEGKGEQDENEDENEEQEQEQEQEQEARGAHKRCES